MRFIQTLFSARLFFLVCSLICALAYGEADNQGAADHQGSIGNQTQTDNSHTKLNRDKLWLPLSYQALQPNLLKAVHKLEMDGHCVKLLRVSMHRSTTSAEDARFLFICRNVQQASFAAVVDAQTLEVDYPMQQTTVVDVANVEPQWLHTTWGACQRILEQKTSFMRDLDMITKRQPSPLPREGGGFLFHIDFDAKTLQGTPLHYRAVCGVESKATAPELHISPRR